MSCNLLMRCVISGFTGAPSKICADRSAPILLVSDKNSVSNAAISEAAVVGKLELAVAPVVDELELAAAPVVGELELKAAMAWKLWAGCPVANFCCQSK